MIVWVSKSLMSGLTSLGLKTGSDESQDMWHHNEACIEAKRSHEGAMSVRCTDDHMDTVTIGGIWTTLFMQEQLGK